MGHVTMPWTMNDAISHLVRALFKQSASKDDPRINEKSTTVSQYFFGYPHLVEWNSSDITPSTYINVQTRAMEAEQWCKENCVGCFTHNVHQVIKCNSYSNKEEWVINDIAGEDIWFWAFELEQDALLFSLKW